jgi:hypothetical protein
MSDELNHQADNDSTGAITVEENSNTDDTAVALQQLADLPVSDNDDDMPATELHDLMKQGIFEDNVPPDVALMARIKNADAVKVVVLQNTMLIETLMHIADQLKISIPISNMDMTADSPTFGQLINYELKITKETIISKRYLGYIAARTRKAIDENVRDANAARTNISNLTMANEQLRLEYAGLSAEHKKLLSKKHPSLFLQPYVLAYLSDKGQFIYLMPPNGPKTRTKNINEAQFFNNPAEAYNRLRLLFTDHNNVVPKAPLLQVYSANLLECTKAAYSPPEGMDAFEKLRENAARYESLMKVGHAKIKVKKKKRKILKPSK